MTLWAVLTSKVVLTFVHLRILRMEVHRSGYEEDAVAAGDGLVEAAFF
jgi:hypothetical protein